MGTHTARRRRAGFQLVAGASAALTFAWLAAGACTAHRFAQRVQPRYEETPLPAAWSGVESLRLTTADGEQLGAWLGAGDSEGPIAVLLHGNGSSRSAFGSLMGEILSEGFGCLAVTLRAHGDSTGAINDFGWSARRDVDAAVTFLSDRCPRAPIVVVGVSAGAAAAIFAAPALGDRVAAYVLEAPYLDLAAAARYRCELQLPRPFSDAAFLALRLWAPLFLRVDPNDIRPLDHVAHFPAGLRTTFLTGALDRKAPAADVAALAEACSADARLAVFPHAGHEALYWNDRERYLGFVLGELAASDRR